jgi:hypothetical protein
VVTNNHFEGKAPANALMLEAMVTGTRPEAPGTLVARYRDALGPWARTGGEAQQSLL